LPESAESAESPAPAEPAESPAPAESAEPTGSFWERTEGMEPMEPMEPVETPPQPPQQNAPAQQPEDTAPPAPSGPVVPKQRGETIQYEKGGQKGSGKVISLWIPDEGNPDDIRYMVQKPTGGNPYVVRHDQIVASSDNIIKISRSGGKWVRIV